MFLLIFLDNAMVGNHTNSETIQANVDLNKAGHSNAEICKLRGLKLRTVQYLIHRLKTGGEKNLPYHKKQAGKRSVASSSVRKVLRRQPEVNSILSVREL